MHEPHVKPLDSKSPTPAYMDKGHPILRKIKRPLENIRRAWFRRAAARLAARDRSRWVGRPAGRTRLAFVLKEITYLKAFMPLVRLWEERYEIVFCVYGDDEKATSPIRHRRHLAVTDPYPRIWFQNAADLVDSCRAQGIVNLFTLEAMPLGEEPYEDPGINLYVITHMTDFNRTLSWYYDKASHILFHSRYMAGDHALRDPEKKFRYTGYSQYLVLPGLNRETILEKYGLPSDRRIIFIFGPQKKFYTQTRCVLRILADYARERGFFLVYKTRRKNPVTPRLRWLLRSFKTVYDESYYPPTSLELMHVSDLVVNFDSTGIQEILMLEKKVVNIHVKVGYRGMNEIYEEDAVADLPLAQACREELVGTLDRMMAVDLSAGMRRMRQTYFPGTEEILASYRALEETFVRA